MTHDDFYGTRIPEAEHVLNLANAAGYFDVAKWLPADRPIMRPRALPLSEHGPCQLVCMGWKPSKSQVVLVADMARALLANAWPDVRITWTWWYSWQYKTFKRFTTFNAFFVRPRKYGLETKYGTMAAGRSDPAHVDV